MKNLGLVIRDLIEKRGLSQKELSEQIKLSEVSLSQIITGKAKPRQVNLTRIMQAICTSPEDEQRLISAYYNAEPLLPDSPNQLERPVEEDNEARVKRYLEMKVASVRLKQQAEAILLQQGITYFKDFIPTSSSSTRDTAIICDFYLPEKKLILECKANPQRDWDRTEITCELLEKATKGFEVLIVVNDECHHYPPDTSSIRKVTPLSSLTLQNSSL